MDRDIELAHLWLAAFTALTGFGRDPPVESDNKVLRAMGGDRIGLDIYERMDLTDELFGRAMKRAARQGEPDANGRECNEFPA